MVAIGQDSHPCYLGAVIGAGAVRVKQNREVYNMLKSLDQICIPPRPGPVAPPPPLPHNSTAWLTIKAPISPMSDPEQRLDQIFSALADPTRRRILAMLLEDDMAVSDVAAPFEVSLAAVSKHLVVLAGAGLIRQERRGRITWCQIDPEGLRHASIWMQGFGQFDPVDLDDFERYLARSLADEDQAAD